MIVEHNTFKNCISLKEVHTEKLDDPISLINELIFLKNDLVIVVRDCLIKVYPYLVINKNILKMSEYAYLKKYNL